MRKLFTVSLLLLVPLAFSAFGQVRDYMTDEEIEIVRDAQDIDKRIEVLTKMIDRRFAALGIEVSGWKESAKDREKWGEVRAGTRSELLWDVRQLLQKAIDDIDNVSEHNKDTVAQNKMEGELFPKAVRGLAAAANRYLPPLKKAVDATKDERDKGLILTSIENCEAIIESVAKLPAETKEKKKGKS